MSLLRVISFLVIGFVTLSPAKGIGDGIGSVPKEKTNLAADLKLLDFQYLQDSQQSYSFGQNTEENVEFMSKKESVEYLAERHMRKLSLPLLRKILAQGDILHESKKKRLDLAIDKLQFTCDECQFAALAIQHGLNSGIGKDLMAKIAVQVCMLVKIEDKRVCEMAVHQFKNEIWYIVFNLTPKELCHWLQPTLCSKPAGYLPDWSISLPDTPKPPVKVRNLPEKGSPVSKVLFLTDIHVDLMYKAASNAECGEPLCCRSNDIPVTNASQSAGKWGDYRNCDMPPWTLEGTLRNLSMLNPGGRFFDFILFTGDFPAHNVWNQTKEDQMNMNDYFAELMKKYFPGTPFYASLGNHASSPVNSYPPPQVRNEPGGDISWLYERVATNWGDYLDENAKKTVLKGGYYTMKIRDRLRIVSLNDNYCSDDDWWILVGNNSVDPVDQLAWLVEVMQKAEDMDEMVIILTHRPTSGCLESWSQNYNKIINRYESSIVAQFFGHAHTDELKLYFDATNTSRVTSVGFIGPGYTTYSYLNAGYRIYSFDGDYTSSTQCILDAVSYYLNITDANLTDRPVWRHEYSFLEEYNMKSLFPSDWEKLIQRFENDDELFQRYHHHITKNEDVTYCDDSCKQGTISNIKNSVAGQ